jgi:hypothetical protein
MLRLVREDGSILSTPEMPLRPEKFHIGWKNQSLVLVNRLDCGLSLAVEGTPPELRLTQLDTNMSRLCTAARSERMPKGLGKTLKAFEERAGSRVRAAQQREQRVAIASWSGVAELNVDGTLLWENRSAGYAVDVDYTPDGKHLVALHGDGTVRWYSTESHEEVLALFLFEDTSRWVLFNPKGFYVASKGAEPFFGRQLSHGARESSFLRFLPAEASREYFMQPLIIGKALEWATVDGAIAAGSFAMNKTPPTDIFRKYLPAYLRQAHPEAPKVVREHVTFELLVTSPSGLPVNHFNVHVDGEPVSSENFKVDWKTDPGVKPEEEHRVSLRVRTPHYSSTVTVTATLEGNHHPGPPFVVHTEGQLLSWKDEFKKRRNLKIFAVGTGKYGQGLSNLAYASKDARDFVSAFQRQEGKLYEKVEATTLDDEQLDPSADKADNREGELSKVKLLKALRSFEKSVNEGDIVLLFFSGHGIQESEQYYFMPTNASRGSTSLSGISGTELQTHLKNLAEGKKAKVFLFLDTCRAGGAADKESPGHLQSLAQEGLARQLAVGHMAVIFTASAAAQNSQESSDWKNGAFTKALVEALTHRSLATDSETDAVHLSRLYSHVRAAVMNMTQQTQTPEIFPSVEHYKGARDLPLVLLRQE